MGSKFKSKKLNITEVVLRDGFQDLNTYIPTEDKLLLFNSLIKAGIKNFEVTSFVSPKHIPQLKDAELFFNKVKNICTNTPDILLKCLVPNLRGFERSQQVGVKEILVLNSASEEFNKKNINLTIKESFIEIEKIIKHAKDDLYFTGVISTAFFCPYEGEVKYDHLKSIINNFINLGIKKLVLADTSGLARTDVVETALTNIKQDFGLDNFCVHFHANNANTINSFKAAIKLGINCVDSSLNGIGGCPNTPNPIGNIETETIVQYCDQNHIKTGINLEKLYETRNLLQQLLIKHMTP